MNSPHMAVDIGTSADQGWGKQKQFPFIYTLMTDAEVKAAGDAENGTPNPGLRVSTKSPLVKYVRLDPDFAHKLLWIKYEVWELRDSSGTVSDFVKRSDSVIDQVAFLPGDPAFSGGQNFKQFMNVSVSAVSSGDRHILGGRNTQPQRLVTVPSLQGSVIPLNVMSAQGYDNGYGQIRTPYLLPRDGVLKFRFVNDPESGSSLYVNAAIFTLKIRV